MKLFDSELQVMQVLWDQGDLQATQIVDILKEKIGWNKNTTYTIVKKCVDKEYIQRTDPGFYCHALITLDDVRQAETQTLADRLFDGAADKLFASLVSGRKLTEKELAEIKKIIQNME